jgi:type II secretory pathway pseudopilin PulG
MMTNRKGFVLPSVIFAITIMSVIVVVALSTASDERRASRATRESTLAMYAAEAGLRQTYGAWPSAPVKALNPGDSLDLGWQNLPNKAAYRAVIHRVDKGGLQEYNVVVQGRRTDPTAGIITIVGGVGGVPIFKYGVYTEGILYLTSGGTFDAYDSDLGPYSLATADSTSLWANSTMTVTQTTVKGDVTAVGAITLGSNGIVTGASTTGATAITPMDILPCPAAGFTPTANVPTGTDITYSSVSGALSVKKGKTLTLADTSYFFSSIVLTGNSKVVFSGGPHTSVYLRDSIDAGAGIISNAALNAAALSFSSCGTSATPAYWALSSSGTSSYYTVYAPNHIVYELGAGDFYGAIVASIYYATGGGKFHYDEALARQPSNKLAVQRGSWAQLPGN